MKRCAARGSARTCTCLGGSRRGLRSAGRGSNSNQAFPLRGRRLEVLRHNLQTSSCRCPSAHLGRFRATLAHDRVWARRGPPAKRRKPCPPSEERPQQNFAEHPAAAGSAGMAASSARATRSVGRYSRQPVQRGRPCLPNSLVEPRSRRPTVSVGTMTVSCRLLVKERRAFVAGVLDWTEGMKQTRTQLAKERLASAAPLGLALVLHRREPWRSSQWCCLVAAWRPCQRCSCRLHRGLCLAALARRKAAEGAPQNHAWMVRRCWGS